MKRIWKRIPIDENRGINTIEVYEVFQELKGRISQVDEETSIRQKESKRREKSLKTVRDKMKEQTKQDQECILLDSKFDHKSPKYRYRIELNDLTEEELSKLTKAMIPFRR
jgi:cytochrome c-type biogenesis protein CcmH/NrfG